MGHLCSIQWTVFSAFNPSLRSSGTAQRLLTGDRPNVRVLMVGRKLTRTREELANSTQDGPAQPGMNPRPSCYEATVLTTKLPCHPNARISLYSASSDQAELSLWSYLLLEDDGRLQTRHDVLQQTTGGRVEVQLSAGHYIRVQQLENKHRKWIKTPFSL